MFLHAPQQTGWAFTEEFFSVFVGEFEFEGVIFILADLEPTERISWIDVDFEPRYNTKLR